MDGVPRHRSWPRCARRPSAGDLRALSPGRPIRRAREGRRRTRTGDLQVDCRAARRQHRRGERGRRRQRVLVPPGDRPARRRDTVVKVLIIDDDADIRFVAAMSLRAGGALDVVEASGGLDGVCKAREEQPDVILLDMMMPTMDGSQTITALRAQKETATTPVIFLTAKTIVAEIQGMKDLGAAGVLIKPFDPRTLAADVLALLT